MDKNCSECGNKFSCDNNITCWCSSFPKLTEQQIDEKDCICRESVSYTHLTLPTNREV